MKEIALVTLLLVSACKSSEKSTGGAPPSPTAAPAPTGTDDKEAAAARPEVKDEAPADPANTLVAGAAVEKSWGEGGPGEVVWKVEGGTVTLRAEPGKPEGVLFATFNGKQQHVTNFACDTREGSQAGFALTAEGKVVFRAAVGPAGKDPGRAAAFLLEWKPDKGTVFVANGWQGTATAEPPPWAKI